jgi:hypothetical protein
MVFPSRAECLALLPVRQGDAAVCDWAPHREEVVARERLFHVRLAVFVPDNGGRFAESLAFLIKFNLWRVFA